METTKTICFNLFGICPYKEKNKCVFAHPHMEVQQYRMHLLKELQKITFIYQKKMSLIHIALEHLPMKEIKPKKGSKMEMNRKKKKKKKQKKKKKKSSSSSSSSESETEENESSESSDIDSDDDELTEVEKYNEALKEIRRSQSQKVAVNDLELKLKNHIDLYSTKEIGGGSNKPVDKSNKNIAEKSKTPLASSKSKDPTVLSAAISGGGAIPKHNKNLTHGHSTQSINDALGAMIKRSKKRR